MGFIPGFSGSAGFSMDGNENSRSSRGLGKDFRDGFSPGTPIPGSRASENPEFEGNNPKMGIPEPVKLRLFPDSRDCQYSQKLQDPRNLGDAEPMEKNPGRIYLPKFHFFLVFFFFSFFSDVPRWALGCWRTERK